MFTKQGYFLFAVVGVLLLGLSACDKSSTEVPEVNSNINTTADLKIKVEDNLEADTQALLSIIEAVRMGWLEADGTPFRRHFLDFEGARYFETGGQNVGLTDLVEHHVEPEADAFTEFELNLSNIETHIEGDFAWALADVKLHAIIKRDGRVIDNKGHETFIFKRIDGAWKVLHTHNSSRPIKKK